MNNTTFQTSAFRVDNMDEFMQKASVVLTCKAMKMVKLTWKVGSDYVSFCLTDSIMKHSDFDDGDLPTKETIVELLELIEKHIIDDDSCSVTYITNKIGCTVNSYFMQITNNSTVGNFIAIDSKNVYGTITPELIDGVSPN